MKKSTGIALLIVGVCLVVLSQNAWAQHPVLLKIFATDHIGTDTVYLGLDPAATNHIDSALGEEEFPPAGPSFDLRSVTLATGLGKDTLKTGVKKNYHHMVRVTQSDRWKIAFQSDDSGSVVTFGWQIVQAGGNGWTMDDGGVNIPTPIDMTTQSSFTYPVKTTSGTGAQFVYINYFDGLKLTTVAQESLTADAALKSAKRKNYVTKFSISCPGAIPVGTGGLHVEFDNVVASLSSIFANASTTDNKKFNLSNASGSITDPIVINGVGGKGKDVKIKTYWYLLPDGVTGSELVKGKPVKHGPGTSVTQQYLLHMPNYNNVGEELYAQGAFPEQELGKPIGMRIGTRDQWGADTKGKPWYRWNVLPKWGDVQKALFKKGVGGQVGAASCFQNYGGKPIVKEVKGGMAPDKLGNVLYAEAVTLKFNIAANAFGKTQNAGFGTLVYYNPSSPFNGMTVQAISDSLDRFMTKCAGVGTANDFNTTVHDLNTAFAGKMDTVSFGQPLGGKSAGATILKGVKAVATVPYLYRTSAELPPVIALPPYRGEETPSNFRLEQNYPNPFNPTTTISFALSQDAIVTLKVFNILGLEVATLVNHEQMTEGMNEVEFDASHLASGVYYYRLLVNDGQFQQVKKMMLIK
jgi:hypothetical protein